MKDFEFCKDLFYKSNKLLLSEEKKYLTKYDWLFKREYNGKDLNIVDESSFWQDQEYLRIFKKKV